MYIVFIPSHDGWRGVKKEIKIIKRRYTCSQSFCPKESGSGFTNNQTGKQESHQENNCFLVE